MKAPSPARLYTLLAFWSFNYVAGKVALREFSPLLPTRLRTAIAGLIIWPVYMFSKPAHHRDVWKEFRTLSLLGLCGMVVNQMFFVLGLARTSVAHAAFMIALTPMLVLGMSAGVGQEHFKVLKGLGMAIALLATLMAIPTLHEPLTLSPAAGGALVLAGVFVTERG